MGEVPDNYLVISVGKDHPEDGEDLWWFHSQIRAADFVRDMRKQGYESTLYTVQELGVE